MQVLFFASFRWNERKRHGGQHANKCRDVIPPDLLLQIHHRESTKHQQRDDFLDDFQLRGGVNIAAPTIGRHLQDVLKKSDAPTREDDEEDRLLFIFQMPIPRERHEDV